MTKGRRTGSQERKLPWCNSTLAFFSELCLSLRPAEPTWHNMALQQLTDEQTRKWTRVEKDEWWLQNVYRGDMAQLTFRSAVTGFVLGGVLGATALYIGGKTG